MGRKHWVRTGAAAILVALATTTAMPVVAAPAAQPQSAAENLLRLSTQDFNLALDPVSQTLVSLSPKSAAGFDFVPSGRLAQRQGDGFYHIGDIDLRLRFAGEEAWRDFSTAHQRRAVAPLAAGGQVLAASDLTPALPGDMPLRIERHWVVDKGQLVMRFRLTNPTDRAIEIGGLGLAMVFDNILSGRSLEEAHEQASFADPYIGRDAGYIQVTRLNGGGPALLVLPEKGTPLEAYKPILDQKDENGRTKLFNDGTKRGQTFEGFYDWMVASKGFAEKEWAGAEQWNQPTSLRLAAGETREIGVRFALSPAIRDIEKTLADNGRPVAVGVPGYVVPMDLPADLFVKSAKAVKSIVSYPAGALKVAKGSPVKGWTRYKVEGKAWGRARLEITYADNSVQTVHYFVIKPAAEAVADMGRFLFTRQWFDDPNDPFKRGPSILSYDDETGGLVLQDERVWIAGLSDEGGAGAWLAAIMKQLGAPEEGEVAKFERFVTETLDGHLQANEGPEIFGVRKSLFFYDPKALPDFEYDQKFDWSTWASWSKEKSYSFARSFNYVHVAAAHWVLYRLARYHEGLVKAHDWRWYLNRAYETTMAMVRLDPYYSKFGQMEGDVYIDILNDLKREGMLAEARALETVMRGRAQHWAEDAYPFGSEMPWDSTGQPEVYAWMRYFGHHEKAEQTREVILGYDPTLPHWGYNGNARRYWDFLYGGKIKQIERQLHHYGSSNNAIPLFDSFRRNPEDTYLLRVAYGGLLGSITNIDQKGFGSAAFHANPDLLKFDAYTGDYGTSFFAHAYTTASYLVKDATFGWVGFGGAVEQKGQTIRITPRDSFRNRLFIAPAGLWLTLDAGRIAHAEYDAATGKVRVVLDPANRHVSKAYLNVETTVAGKPAYRPGRADAEERGSYVYTLSATPTVVELAPVAAGKAD